MRRRRSSRTLPESVVILLWASCAQVPVEGVPAHHHAKKAGTAGAVAAGQGGSRGHGTPSEGSAGWSDGFEPFVNQLPNVKKYDLVDYSHNWCPVKEAILSGRVHFKDALRGHNVSFLMAIQDNPVSVIYDKSSRTVKGGMPVEVFEEVAKRLGFNWKRNSAVVDYIDRANNETDNEWLEWGTRHFDVVDWFTITPDRSRKGLMFAYPFIDVSPHLVGELEVKGDTVWDRYLACFSPFTFSLWAMIVVGFFLSACVYVCLEGGGDDIPQKTAVGGTSQAFFLTVCQFTGGGGFAPHTPSGKLFVMSASFLVMLLVTAYTANLASELIIDQVAKAPIENIEDAITRDKKICVRKGSPFFRMMTRRYPDAQLFLVNHEADKFPAIPKDCIAAVVGQTWWEFERRMAKFNPHCKLYAIGRNLMDMKGSFVARATSATCKEVVIDVMTFTMHQMYLDGFLTEVEDAHIDELEDVYCPARRSVDTSSRMQPRHMFGIFLVHGMVSLVCIGVSIYAGHFGLPGCGKSGRSLDDLEDDSMDSDSRE